MARKKRDFSRPVLPDPKFHDQVVSKTINIIMKHGKKSTAERALYSALDIVSQQNASEPVDSFKKALAAIRPVVEVRSRRVGGATYQVPTEVRGVRAESLSIRWLILGANSRGEKTLAERLAGEILDALQNRGAAIKKREETHRMAEANKAFAHFRWN